MMPGPRLIDDSTFLPADGTFFFTPQGLLDFVRQLDDSLKERGWPHSARKDILEACLDILKTEVSR